MEFDFERVISDLRRKRADLAAIIDNLARTQAERTALLRAVERIREPLGLEDGAKESDPT